MNELINLYKILSDETRIRILNLLFKQELCVCELTELLDLPQPKISKHIAKIRNANLVTTIRNEQYIYYSVNKSNQTLIELIGITQRSNNKTLIQDLEKLNNKTSFVCTKAGN